MHATASTYMLKPVCRPFLPRTLMERLRGRYATPDEERAKRLLAAVAPTAHKLRRRNRTALAGAVSILEVATVELHQVDGILRALPDTPHLLRVRNGRVSDSDLWADARDTMDMVLRGHGSAGSDRLMGQCLAVVDVLLSVPEGERAAVVGVREMA